MQISLPWINELVDLQETNIKDLIDKLTLGGFEVEDVFKLDINNKLTTILDISTTANRSDSLSIKGISKEISSLVDKPCNNNNYLRNKLEWEHEVTQLCLNHKETENSLTFVTIKVQNLITHTSPKWLKEKLLSSGITPLDNLLDFQNYILLETGYPFEFYDYDKISSNVNREEFDLTLTTASNNEQFIANNNLTYSLTSDNLVIKADSTTIGIGGTIVSDAVAYSNETTTLLIEGSIFNSKKIRQQSRKLGLRTDRSARYEKGLNNTDFIESFYRLLKLIKVQNPTISFKLSTLTPLKKNVSKSIQLKYENINEILGSVRNSFSSSETFINPIQISKYLQRLGFKFLFDKDKILWTIEIPSSRADDLTREIDLIEEIGRLHGFNNFTTTLPKLKRTGIEDYSYQIRKKLTSSFISSSFNELIQYSLVNKETSFSNEVKLLNPLASDCAFLRVSLLPKLVETLSENLKQTNSNLNGFEYGHVFSKTDSTTFIENEKIAGIFGGTKTKLNWSEQITSLSWFESKGKLEQLFEQLDLTVYWRIISHNVYSEILHPYRTAELYLKNGKILGIFGEIHPVIAKKQQIPNDVYLFELNFELLKQTLQDTKLATYRPYSLYPKIIKDLSFIIDQNISFEDVKKSIRKCGTKFLNEIKLLDEYTGKSIPTNKRSICIQLIFQSEDKTLKTKEIENILDTIELILIEDYKISIRS